MKTALENLDIKLPSDVRYFKFDSNVFKLAVVKMVKYSNTFFVYLDLEKKYYLFDQQIRLINEEVEFVEWV